MSHLNRKKFGEPIFNFEDLKVEDLKEQECALRKPIEREKLQAIYTHAYIYDLLYKFAKDHLPDIENVNSVQNKNTIENEKSTDTTVDMIKDKVINYLLNLDDKKEEKNVPIRSEEETEKTNIWTTSDLNVLRRNFSSIKEKNISLNSRLMVLQEENIRLKDSIEILRLENKKFKNEKLTLEQENERIYIRVQDLERLHLVNIKEIDSKDKERMEMLEKIDKLNRNIQELKNHNAKLEFNLNKCEFKMNSIKNETSLYYSNQVETLKIAYKKEIEKLKERLEYMTDRYKAKKAENQKAQKSLEHLRIHFMSGSSSKHKINDDEIRIK